MKSIRTGLFSLAIVVHTKGQYKCNSKFMKIIKRKSWSGRELNEKKIVPATNANTPCVFSHVVFFLNSKNNKKGREGREKQ